MGLALAVAMFLIAYLSWRHLDYAIMAPAWDKPSNDHRQEACRWPAVFRAHDLANTSLSAQAHRHTRSSSGQAIKTCRKLDQSECWKHTKTG